MVLEIFTVLLPTLNGAVFPAKLIMRPAGSHMAAMSTPLKTLSLFTNKRIHKVSKTTVLVHYGALLQALLTARSPGRLTKRMAHAGIPTVVRSTALKILS